jgi:hypothetical protein
MVIAYNESYKEDVSAFILCHLTADLFMLLTAVVVVVVFPFVCHPRLRICNCQKMKV